MHAQLIIGWLLFICIFFLLLSDNCAATTAAFPPNGRGQINLPLLMSANGTGPFLPPPPSACRSEREPRPAFLMMDSARRVQKKACSLGSRS